MTTREELQAIMDRPGFGTGSAFRAADKRRAVMGTNEEVTVAHVADHVGKSARK